MRTIRRIVTDRYGSEASRLRCAELPRTGASSRGAARSRNTRACYGRNDSRYIGDVPAKKQVAAVTPPQKALINIARGGSKLP
ncbi:MAG: hypothetical protein CMJ58_12310 [Planctomycetaceae bacterium]|nr:hypothetical protein [Planctomycetaceae bacterium]